MKRFFGWFCGVAIGSATISTCAHAAEKVSTNQCFESSAARHGLDARLLRAIARVESGMNPRAMNLSHQEQSGTVDVGLMQINSGWLPTLAKFGINEGDLKNVCTNIDVGAWILSGVMKKNGNDWQAVGAYNAACTKLKGTACTAQRSKYAWKVYRSMGVKGSPGQAEPIYQNENEIQLSSSVQMVSFGTAK